MVWRGSGGEWEWGDSSPYHFTTWLRSWEKRGGSFPIVLTHVFKTHRPQLSHHWRNIKQGSLVLLDIGYNSRQETKTEPIGMVGLVLWNLLYMCNFLLPPCHYLYSTAVQSRQSRQAKFIATKNATFMQNLLCQCNKFSYKRLDFHLDDY